MWSRSASALRTLPRTGLRVRVTPCRPLRRTFASAAHDDHHDHHVAVDLSKLERPIISSDQLYAYLPAEELQHSPASPEALKAEHGYLLGPEYFPEADWGEQLLGSTSVLECLAEFSSTEYSIPVSELSGSSLKAKYRQQYVHFVTVRAPAMVKEGISRAILHKLKDIYKIRTLVSEEEIQRALVSVFAILSTNSDKKNASQWRLTFNGNNQWPLWKMFEVRLPGMGDRIRPEYAADTQWWGRHAVTNAESCKVNIEMFRGTRAFMKAVDRGLTAEERAKVKAIILRNPLDDNIDEHTKKAVAGFIAELQAMSHETQADRTAYVKRYKEIANAFGKDAHGVDARMYFYRSYPHSEEFVKSTEVEPQEGDVVLELGVHYFASPEEAAAKRAEMKKELIEETNQLHQKVVAGGDAAKIKQSERMKASVDFILEENTQGTLELMQLLQSTPISDRRLNEIAAVFSTEKADPASDDLLNQVLNPHPVAQKLWATRVQYLCMDHTSYTEEFMYGNETLSLREKNWPREKKPYDIGLIDNEEVLARHEFPRELYFNSAQEELFHAKLFRLADDYLDLNLGSDAGILAFENFVHTYDVSPGEATLERCFSGPPPAHTFAELPIIKFDGWEEADVVPEGVHITHKAGH